MLFNSFTFLIFLVLTLAAYNGLPRWTHRKVLLLTASYIFYAAWNPPFVILLWISTTVDWYCAGRMPAATAVQKRWLLLLSLSCNLGLLGFFKYATFFAESFATVASLAGLEYAPAKWSIVLPVGISFYTFQSMSYTLDVYRGKLEPGKSFLDFALYVTFFPQLVAGPIVRAREFLPQCVERRSVSMNQIGWGFSLLTLGVFQKAIADGFLAPVADEVFAMSSVPMFMSAWVGTLAFAGQIYCDFAGYSISAIGVAMCFGFALPDNFHAPYAARGFSDFWRRWHISLSTWLRDYLYIPLGGSRHGVARTMASLMLTMLLGGLWHGASWTFVVWGGLHGTLLVLERVVKQTSFAKHSVWETTVARLWLQLATFAAICVTWVFFRSADFDTASRVITGMVGGGDSGGGAIGGGAIGGGASANTNLTSFAHFQVIAPIAGLLLWQTAMRDKTLEWAAERVPTWCLALWLTFMLTAISLMPGDDRAFLYFQF